MSGVALPVMQGCLATPIPPAAVMLVTFRLRPAGMLMSHTKAIIAIFEYSSAILNNSQAFFIGLFCIKGRERDSVQCIGGTSWCWQLKTT